MKKCLFIIGMASIGLLSPQCVNAQQTLEEVKDSLNAIVDLAKKGDAKAQNVVGSWYYAGKHVKQNYTEAAQWWARSAKQGYAQGIGNLGLCYQTGHGVTKDSLRAIGLYNRSIREGNTALFAQNQKRADEGSIFDCVFVGSCYQKGIGTQRDLNKALNYYLKAASRNSVDAQREAALLYLNGKKPEEAIKWFKRGADNGDMPSIFYYGKMLHDGMGVKQDVQQGMIYLLKAAEAEFPMGQYEVAQAYFKGEGVMKSPEQGVEWLIKAANNGVSNAQYQLARRYVDGDGLPSDFDQAVSWFAIALPKGHINAFKKLFKEGENSLKGSPFHAYLKGLRYYSDKDFDNALKQFKAVEKEKHEEGKTMQGVILANKDYAKYNLKKGIKALKKAAEGSPMANYLLGGIYEAGKGVDRDMEQALAHLTQAADANYAPALCYLGDMYYEGRGVEQNYEKAIDYYNKAKGQLSPNASKRLASCYENGWGVEVDEEKAQAILKMQGGSTNELLKLVPMN